MSEREIIEEQIRYYRARASEYDDTADWRIDPFEEEWHVLVAALDSFGPRGRVLEIACGTGQWTRRLLDYSTDITAIDSSPEMIGIAKEKLHDHAVRYVETDVFSWTPDARYDVVFFANWLSHVPPEGFDRFWTVVRAALAPGGRVFFVDEAQDAKWRHEEFTAVPHVVTRRLRDGGTFRAVKVFWEPDALEERLRALGWDIEVVATPALLYGHGRFAV
jgi:SAM-dependent methyltransferase